LASTTAHPVPDFATKRLTVCNWALSVRNDRPRLIDDLTSVLTPQVLQHLPATLQIEEADGISGWIDARATECDVYVIRHKDRVIGLLILVTDGDTLHLGYLLAQGAWGRGFASEMLTGLLAVVPKGIRVMGGVGLENPASAHVLRKLGFSRDPDLSSHETDMFVFKT
jgi:RimJ/RimL family protein N-acetyltransferase